MVSALEFVATFAAISFAGAALYIEVAEHPARMALETRSAVLQWAPSYKRALLDKWAKLHAVHKMSSLAASVIYLWLLRGA